VFTQYNQDAERHRTPLPTPNIDTGMGVERTLAVIEGKPSPYETSLFLPLVNRICRLSAKEYGGDQALDRAIRVVSDHSRSIAFLIADGVVPSNEGRGYVLRRVLRRASLFGQKLGLDDPFLNEMIEVVLSSMGHVYPELVDKRSLISAMVKNEEERFATTLDTGLNLVEKLIGEASVQGREGLEGGEVFRLYDTYGFPPELTAEIAGEKGLSIDWEGFQAEMEKQRARARVGLKVTASAKYTPGSTHYVGDITLEHRSAVVLLISDGKRLQEQGDSVSQGQDVDVILRETPFYGEMGGQVGDVGEIRSPRGKMIVTNTIRIPSDLIVHQGRVIEGDISVGDEVEARVDVALRQDIARNHTATHLLQAALRQMVDPCIEQKGSLVEPERFRFDFSYLGEVTEERLHEIQRQVNDWIRQNLKTGEKKDIPYRQAIAEGAIALFEEKYGEKVRMLEIGEPAISKELCGGTHVNSTGEIGLFLITSESSIGTGLHRIEAVTGRSAESLIESRAVALQNIAKSVESSLDEAPSKVEALVHGLETERKRTLSLERELLRITAERLVNQVEQLSDVTVLTAKVPALSMPSLREMGDVLRDKLKSAIVVLATIYDGKPSFLTMVTPDLIARGFHAGDIINQVARVTGGGGGGKAAMAQAGGKDPAKVDEALRLVRKLIEKV
jgi:alanyl-tRNA synthetase